MGVWTPVARALRKAGPIVVPIVIDKVRREAQPYWEAYQHARRIDGHVGVWQDDEGKHWVVFDAARSAIAGSFPPLSPAQRRLALDNLDVDQLHHHTDTVFARIEQAPARIKDALPRRSEP